jgi:hypothetical protein
MRSALALATLVLTAATTAHAAGAAPTGVAPTAAAPTVAAPAGGAALAAVSDRILRWVHVEAGKNTGPTTTPPGFAKLGKLEQGDYYASAYELEDAMTAYEAALNDAKLLTASPARWELAAKRLLALVVHVQPTPRFALEILSRIRDEKGVPPTLLKASTTWRQEIKQWIDDTKTPSAAAANDTLAQARTLMAAGAALDAKTQTEGAGLVVHLRAGKIASKLLRPRTQLGAADAEALEIGGRAAAYTAALHLGPSAEDYLEACIRVAPRTASARTCFQALTTLPPAARRGHEDKSGVGAAEAERLAELKKLAG